MCVFPEYTLNVNRVALTFIVWKNTLNIHQNIFNECLVVEKEVSHSVLEWVNDDGNAVLLMCVCLIHVISCVI